jgi:hypothetical protein
MSVFISYSSQDKEFARRLADDLKNYGTTVWFDETELLPGDSIIGTIEAVIDQMAFLIVVLSPQSVVSEWVTQEVRLALHNGISGKRVSVIPVLRETCQIPGFLRDLKYADMRSDQDYPASLEKLVEKIRCRLETQKGGKMDRTPLLEPQPVQQSQPAGGGGELVRGPGLLPLARCSRKAALPPADRSRVGKGGSGDRRARVSLE